MAKDAVRRAMARRPKLPPIEEPLRASPPRLNLLARNLHWSPALRQGVAVKGWVFHATADESDSEMYKYAYEAAYELDGQVHVFSAEMRIDPNDRRCDAEYGGWFRDTVVGCCAATVLVHPELGPVLFGEIEPFENVLLRDQLARAQRAPAERRAKEIEWAIEIVQDAWRADRSGVARLLAPFGPEYTHRTYDDGYLVADLYGYARNGGDVLAILEQIAPKLPNASKEYWAAE